MKIIFTDFEDEENILAAIESDSAPRVDEEVQINGVSYVIVRVLNIVENGQEMGVVIFCERD